MNKLIINVTLTLAVAMSLALEGCSPNYDRVIEESSKAIKKNPRDSEAYRARAGAWEKKGDYDRAIEDYTKAIELDPGDITLYYLREYLYRETGSEDS